MRRDKMRATRYPGVFVAGDRTYWIRLKIIDKKTGRTRQVNRLIEAASAAEAAGRREQLRTASAEPERPRIRLGEYAISWLSGVRRTLKRSTADRYARTVANHIGPQLGDHYLDALAPQDVIAWRDSQEGEASSINSRLRVLKTLLKSATLELGLPRDPALGVSTVRCSDEGEADDGEGALLGAEELAVLLDSVSPTWRPLFSVLAYTALRVGEATALRWDDLDEAAGAIRVRRAQWRGVIDTPKTGRRRSVPLPPKLAAILREHRRCLVATQHPGLGSGWVFPAASVRRPRLASDGSVIWPPVSTSSLRKPLLAALKAAELDGRISVHGLRRTWNNLLRQVAAGEVVRSITGHVTERMTEHYSHVGQSEKAAAATAALSLVRKPASEVCT